MEYTLDELVTAVASRLTAVGLDRQGNGQVNAFPDRRTLRYYTTLGLMDRPGAVRDRQARYGERHVAQAVAVKRLQASGLTLAAAQSRLAGLPPAEVEAIAAGRDGAATAPGGRRFWAETAVASDFPPHRAENLRHPPSAVPALPLDGARPLLAVALSADATLLLSAPGPLTAADIAAIRSAAAALLDQLAHLSPAAPHGTDLERKDYS